ncbi:3-oxoacyl-[acyl-carrier-protein] synthase II [Sporothrix brasiliensis 5110]|uniref:3-oxoacyl-[acyl-carrier-protein] synthase, mitochondrial n=1 Tax=Sporothrix brasiliensis 5110 TaxID=1398154 RepID=A0A0C2IT65_9PEZI|nr:3-oxoacyl-[acyl-carrier-protein] synthase II [Sporothrix brasiliensis 5110]KIH92236.1 3-oxoacyl-[acyl-carrier-protein] synthase II [Sporothrix brasiliensis 5110]
MRQLTPVRLGMIRTNTTKGRDRSAKSILSVSAARGSLFQLLPKAKAAAGNERHQNEVVVGLADMLRRVVVTGLGAVTPLGVGARFAWKRLVAGESGITSVADRTPIEQWERLPSTIAGAVPDGKSRSRGQWNPDDWVDEAEQRRMSRFTQFAMAATDMALAQAQWPGPEAVAAAARKDAAARTEYAPDDSPEARTGVCIGSGVGNLEAIYETSLDLHHSGYKRVSPLFVPRILINMAAGHVAMRHNFQGPNHSASTACTTGAHAIGDAARFIALGDADVMVAGGAEACIHPLTFAGFGRSRSLADPVSDDPTKCSRPFDRERSGFVVAEGAAVLLLEELEHALARGAPILAELRGYGCSGDAFHMTAPHPHGVGAQRAMRAALKNAGLRPRDVDYINAHATGTVIGDRAEAAAIRTLMADDDVTNESAITVSSTKGAVGHLLGAAGALEALFTVLAITDNLVPPTLNLITPDVGPNFNFVREKGQEKKVDVALTNSFGFGGTNASLVFSKFK